MHQHDLHELLHVMHLPFWQRMLHVRTRRHILGVGLGTTLMLTGSNMALHYMDVMPHVMWDALAYGIHGVGFIPLARHAEPLWDLLTGTGLK